MAWPEYPFKQELVSTGSWFDPNAKHWTKTGVGDYFPGKEETDAFCRVGLDPVNPSWEGVKGLLLAARIPANELRKLSVPAIAAILSQLQPTQEVSRESGASKEPDSVADAPKSPTLSKDTVQPIVRASLLHHHRYKDGEVGNCIPLPAKEIVDQIAAETRTREGTVKSAVSRAFATLFGDGGHATYRNYCVSQKLLLHWCIRQAGDGKAFSVGTLDAGELTTEDELQNRVASRD